MSERIQPEVAKVVTQTLLGPSLRPAEDTPQAVPPVCKDQTYVSEHAHAVPWPSAPDFDSVSSIVGTTCDFEWIACGPKVQLWRVETQETVTLLEVEGRVLSVHAERVAGAAAMWWVFLATPDSVAWCSVDADLRGVAFIDEVEAHHVARLLICAGKAVVVSNDGSVSLIRTDIAAGKLTVVGHQSLLSWARSWVSKVPTFVDAATDDGAGIVYVLDSDANLCAWDAVASGGPAKLWSTALQLPSPGVGLYVCRGHAVIVATNGDRFACDVSTKPDKKTDVVGKGGFNVRVERVVRDGAITVVPVAGTAEAVIAVEAPSLWSGPQPERVMSCVTTVPSAGIVHAASIRYLSQDRAVVTLIGAFGIHQIDVASPSRMVDHQFRQCADAAEPLARIEASVDGRQRAAWFVFDALAFGRREGVEHNGPLTEAFAQLAAPTKSANGSYALSPAAVALIAAVRSSAPNVFGTCAAVDHDIFVPLLSCSSDALTTVAADVDRTVAIAADTLGPYGFTDARRHVVVGGVTWVAPFGNPPSVRFNAHDVGLDLADSAAVGLQARYLAALQHAARRLATMLRLLAAAMRLLPETSVAGITVPALHLVLAPASEPDLWLAGCIQMARALCAASRVGTTAAADEMEMLPEIADEISAWVLGWSGATPEGARKFVCDNALALHQSGGLPALADRFFTESPLEGLRLCEALGAAATAAHDETAHAVSDSMLLYVLNATVEDHEGLQRLVSTVWERSGRRHQKVTAAWLVEQESRADGLRLAPLFAMAPKSVAKDFRHPSACVAEFHRAHGRERHAAEVFLEVARESDTALDRRWDCVVAGLACCPPDAADVQDELHEAQFRLHLQREMRTVVRRALDSPDLDRESREAADQHSLEIDTAFLNEQDLFDAATRYRPWGGALIELKLLARAPAADPHDWAEAIEAAIDVAMRGAGSEADKKSAAIRVAMNVIGDANAHGTLDRVPLSFVVSAMEVFCGDDDDRLAPLLHNGASMLQLFDAYMCILEERATVHPKYTTDPQTLLLTITKFVRRATETAQGAADREDLKRMFNIVRNCVGRQQSALRTSRGASQANAQLAEAERILDQCEDAAMGTTGMGGMNSQLSFVY